MFRPLSLALLAAVMVTGCATNQLPQTPQQRLDAAKLVVTGLETGYGVICNVKPKPDFCDQIAFDAAESAVDSAIDAAQLAINNANGQPLDQATEDDLFNKIATATQSIEKLVNDTKSKKHKKDALAAPAS